MNAQPTNFVVDGAYQYPLLNRELDRVRSEVFLGKTSAFYSAIMASLEFKWDEQCETAATNGVWVKWGPQDFVDCAYPERVSTFIHELQHVGRLHMVRMGSRDPHIWNYACDVVINRDLIDSGYPNGKSWVPYHREIPHIVEEDIYDFLKKNNYPIPQDFGLAGDMQQGDDEDGDGQSSPGQDPASIKNQMVNTVIRAMHSAKMENQAGTIPGMVEQTIKAYLAPIIDWEGELQRWFTDLLEDEHTWRRPNRRYMGHDLYLPSRYQDEGRLEHLAYYLDVSGSISDEEVLRFNSEVKFIKDTFNPQKLTLVQFDTRITDEKVIKENDAFDEVKVIGRGGTDLTLVRKHILKHKPTCAIIFSDLYVTPMAPLEEDIPILWISTTDLPGPFGKTINIKV